MSLLKKNPVPRYDGLVEGKARLRTVPLDELQDGMVVRTLRTR